MGIGGATAEVDDALVEISVAHGSFEEADFAVMVGCYEDEGFTGAERFLDRQLHGVLSASREAGRYSGPIERAALFIEPLSDPTSATSPPGAYVIGLGRSLELTRARLRLAVAQALVARCLHLRPDVVLASNGERVDVGVSSMLLGVRDNEGLVVADAVAGIVEGVLDANRSLARYEAARARVGSPVSRPVRIARLELIERYSDRADLTGVAVRGLANTVRLPEEYRPSLESTVVRRKRGGLPAGSTLVDGQQNWRRFSITSPSGAPAPVGDEPTLRFDVSLLGGDARADRVVHDLDRVAVEALADQLGHDSSDTRTAETLYDLLVPEQLRKSFQSLSTVQLIVDETSANYPWELLGAPRPGSMVATASQGSIVRQFSETGRSRLVTERAGRGTALVIAAGNVPGQKKLAGAFDEAETVSALLRDAFGEKNVTYLNDKGGRPLSTVSLVNALDGDHQVLHIASHGEFVAGDSATTGALLNAHWRLRVETIRQIRRVPDVVFLNCCSLGKVGMNRLAAGLAREFMAIGCRVVIAAGWSVEDAAAEAFASAFYERFLDGATYSEAIAAARIGCARTTTGRQTWAAYQCYGDPTFAIGDAAPSSTSRQPVSADDLLRHLETLEVLASDLGRPGSGHLEKRRAQLVETRRALERCVDEGTLTSPDTDENRTEIRIQRLVAKVAAELGELSVAARRYLRLVEPTDAGDGKRSAPTRWTTLEDLQQASNCLSRAALKDVRGSGEAGCTADAKRDLLRAVDLGRRAVDLSPEGESWGILAGALKRLAIVETGEERARRIGQAAAAYQRRLLLEPDGTTGAGHASVGIDEPYTRHNAAQLALVLDRGAVVEIAPAARVEPTPTIVDQRVSSYKDYWEAATFGDELLTRMLAANDRAGAADLGDLMVAAYERAFASRSTWKERSSTFTHLCDLLDLLPEGDDRRDCLREAIGRLGDWESTYVDNEVGATSQRSGTEEER